MKVRAKCIARCWDSANSKEYVPNGGPYGGLYEIDTDSQLATLTTSPVAYDEKGNAIRYVRGIDGVLKMVPAIRPPYVFEFDRNANPDETPHDYACKKCGKPFKTLAELGRHSNQEHRDVLVAASLAEPDFDEPVVAETRGKKKGKTFKCKTCDAILPNIYQMGVHNKLHKELAAQEAQPQEEHASA